MEKKEQYETAIHKLQQDKFKLMKAITSDDALIEKLKKENQRLKNELEIEENKFKDCSNYLRKQKNAGDDLIKRLQFVIDGLKRDVNEEFWTPGDWQIEQLEDAILVLKSLNSKIFKIN